MKVISGVSTIAVLSALLFNCSSSLQYATRFPSLKRFPDQAHCIVVWSGEDKGKPSALYADGKFITWTEPGAVISFPIHPGQHLLTLSSDGHIASVMLQFQVNKLYYLRILPTSRGAGPITLDWVELIPISEDKYSKVMIEGSCNYAQTLPDRMGQDMAPVDYNEALEDFRDDAKTGSRFERWLNEYNGF